MLTQSIVNKMLGEYFCYSAKVQASIKVKNRKSEKEKEKDLFYRLQSV